jgi:hypothetical protein
MRLGHFLKTSCGSPNYAAPDVRLIVMFLVLDYEIYSESDTLGNCQRLNSRLFGACMSAVVCVGLLLLGIGPFPTWPAAATQPRSTLFPHMTSVLLLVSQ